MGEETFKDLFIYRIESDGTYSEPIKFNGIKSVTLNESILDPDEGTEQKIFLSHTRTTFTGPLKLPYTKMSKKKFKKWCMSNYISRDVAEALCLLIKSYHGMLSYENAFCLILFDTNRCSKLTEESKC